MVLAARLGLDAAGDVDRVGPGDLDRLGDVLRASGRRRGSTAPRSGGPRSSSQSKVSPVPPAGPWRYGRRGGSRCGRPRRRGCRRRTCDVDRLDHLDPGAAGDLGAEGDALVAVELDHRELLVLGRPGDLVERRVDEHADDLGLAPEGGGRSPRRRRARPARGLAPSGSARSPRRRGRTASAASSRLVIPQTLTRIHPAYGTTRSSTGSASARSRIRPGGRTPARAAVCFPQPCGEASSTFAGLVPSVTVAVFSLAVTQVL